jgi:hypothetical protein
MRTSVVICACWFLIACDQQKSPTPKSEPSAAAAAPYSPAPSSSGEPPFSPITQADILKHARLRWVLQVLPSDAKAVAGLPPGDDVFGGGRRWLVSETRAGDVPMPSAWPWRCRFDHIEVGHDNGAINRAVRCSVDGWNTTAGDSATIWPGEPPVAANVATRRGRDEFVDVILIGCTAASQPGCGTAPELP